MKLPGGARAVVDIAKLRDYCLNPLHARGRHKARLFASLLGFSGGHAALLRDALLRAAVDCEATLGEGDDYGQRYVLDFRMIGPRGEATVRSSWIVRKGENFPRLTSCYIA